MLCKHQLLPHAAYFHLFLHHDGYEDPRRTSQFSALPPAVSRPEEVSAPLAPMFPYQALSSCCRSKPQYLLHAPTRRKMENLSLPRTRTLAANAAKRGGGKGGKN